MLKMTNASKTSSLSGSFITEINQVCIVTNDLEKNVRELSKRFGIGPFKCWNYKLPSLFKTKFRGKELLWTVKLALAWVGNTQWEVVQPLEGPSLYQEYLHAHGEGVHHLLVDTGSLSFDRAIERLVAMNFPLVQEGMINAPVKLGFLTLPRPRFAYNLLCPRFAYMDTEDATKTSLELLNLPPLVSLRRGCSILKCDYWIPAGNTDINASLPNSFISQIFKIGIVTHDLDETLRNYVERLKIGPWRVYNLQSPKLSQTKLRGKDTNFSMRLALTYVGNTLLEIVQPLQGASLYQEFLESHGEGVHYLGIATEGLNFSEAIERFAALGCPVVMEGELENAYRFAYLDTKPFAKTTLEVVSIPVREISTALERLKPDQWYSAK